jgi:hypothetical protein
VPIINCTINSSNFYIKIFFEKQLFSMELIAQQTHLKFNSREKKRKIQKRKKKITEPHLREETLIIWKWIKIGGVV